MSNVIFIGPPGCGKGTQADILAKNSGYVKIAMGDLLREEIKNDTIIGKKIGSYMKEGTLVPDNLTSKIISKAISNNKEGNIIFDGFPRSLNQAEMLKEILEDTGLKIDIIVNFDLPLNVLYERICNRRLCSNCQSPFSVGSQEFNELKKCTYCGNESFFVREDDKKEIFEKRMDVYKEENGKIIEFYQNNYHIFTIDGNQDINKISEVLKNYLLSVQRS